MTNIEKIVDILEKNWISIILKFDVKIDAIKIYSLELVDREFMNQEFNKLHDQDRMQFITQSIFFKWSDLVI